MVDKALKHFVEFHQGTVNIICHILGFAGVFYGIYQMDWVIFAVALLVLEFGHVYNHFAGIKKYDFRPKVTFWRVALFAAVVGGFYLIVN